MNKNDIIEFDINDIGTDGQGIGRHEDMAVFVSGALPGERIRAKVIALKKKYAVAKAEEILAPSPMRVEPPCPYFGRCGGCTLQHLSYAGQLEYKQERVKSCVERIGGLDGGIVSFPLPSAHDYRYRNKAAFPCKAQNGRIDIGLYAPHSHRVIDIDDCRIQHADLEIVMSQLRVWIVKYAISIYNEETCEGLLRHVVLRTNKAGDIMLILVINGEDIPKKQELLVLFRFVLPQVKSIMLNHNKEPGNVIMGKESTVLLGRDYFFETIQGLDFKIGPSTFLQVNHTQTEALYSNLFKSLQIKPDETVVDLFCGAGTITLPAAKRAKRAIGVEIVAEAAENARFNARLNGIENAEFHAGDATSLAKELLSEHRGVDVIITDPPRKGLTPELIGIMVQAQPERIGYVSCDPATLARDLALFAESGYRPAQVQPVDMFPNTVHVETVTVLRKEQHT